MAEFSARARPYAKAAFEIALKHDALPAWGYFLEAAAYMANDARVQAVLFHPQISSVRKAQLFLDVCGRIMSKQQENFIQLMAAKNRLALLPEVERMFHALRAAHEESVDVIISSAVPLEEAEQAALSHALTQKMKKSVNTDFVVDKSLLGGVLIRSGDIVIDGSIRGKFNRLKSDLLTNTVGEQVQ